MRIFSGLITSSIVLLSAQYALAVDIIIKQVLKSVSCTTEAYVYPMRKIIENVQKKRKGFVPMIEVA